MAPEQPSATSDGAEEIDLAKAFQELAKGERTATALENQLSTMEAKIEELLVRAEREQQEVERTREANSQHLADGGSDRDQSKPNGSV